MAELIEGAERDRRRLAELLDGIRVGPGVDAMADGMREAVWADVRSRIRRRGIRMQIVRSAAAAAVMAGVVCGSWFMGGRRTESRLVAAAQPVSVSTPLGVKSDVVLPDGSRVRLNGGTRIVYPALFGDERRVEVDGEAYFEVEHDARRPFVVVTGQVVSTVLGTTFNVHAYSEDENYQITLAPGSLPDTIKNDAMKRTILIVMLLTGICIGKIQAQNDPVLAGQGAERAEKPGEGDDAADYRTYMDERGSTGYGRPAKGVQQVSGFFPVHRLLCRTDLWLLSRNLKADGQYGRFYQAG